MQPSTSKLYAFTRGKCPHCRRGEIFVGNMYSLNMHNDHEYCAHCGQKYEIEPGYFYAAMYVSYAMNVIEMLTVGLLTFIFFGPLEDATFYLYLITIFSGCIILYPFNYRYSRIILLHWLSPKIHYDSNFDK